MPAYMRDTDVVPRTPPPGTSCNVPVCTMSADSTEIIAYVHNWRYNQSIAVATTVLVLYEYAITFKKEVALYWKGKLSGGAIVFYANRYIQLLAATLPFFLWASEQHELFTTQSCKVFYTLLQTLTVAQFLPWAAFSSMRVFALSERRNRWLSALVVFMFYLPTVTIDLVSFQWAVFENDSTFGCQVGVNVPAYMAHRFTLASRLCLMAADAIVISVTWSAIREAQRLTCVVNGFVARKTFSRTIWQHGLMYFIIVFGLNTLHLTLTFLAIAVQPVTAVSPMNAFTEPITGILMSRFLFDLRSVSQSLGSNTQVPTEIEVGTELALRQSVNGVAELLASPSDGDFGDITSQGRYEGA